MNLQKINDFYGKLMIATFVAIMILSIITFLIPIFANLTAGLLLILFFTTGLHFVTNTILFVIEINRVIEILLLQYGKGKTE